jgi:hypothetical protein
MPNGEINYYFVWQSWPGRASNCAAGDAVVASLFTVEIVGQAAIVNYEFHIQKNSYLLTFSLSLAC